MFSNNQSSKMSQKLRNTDIKTSKSLEELKSTSLTLVISLCGEALGRSLLNKIVVICFLIPVRQK